MSIIARSTDVITPTNLLIGSPTVEFAPKTAPGVFGPFRSLGIINDASFTKELETIVLSDASSGTEKTIRELVQSFEARLVATVFKHDGANMQLLFASSTLTTDAGGNAVIVDEPATIGGVTSWGDLDRPFMVSFQDLDPATITLEAIGTGQGGTFGQVLGDFALDFPILVIGDVPTISTKIQFFHSGVSITDLAPARTLVGGNPPVPAANQIGINTTAVANSGKIIYPAGEAPAAGVVLTATYTPSFNPVQDVDYIVDFLDSRVRVTAATFQMRANQPVLVDYTVRDLARNEIKPFTQFVFEGQCRVRLLTDVGINIDWTIPLVNLRLTDDDFTFSREDFGSSSVSITLLDDGTTTPFGTMRVYAEGATAP